MDPADWIQKYRAIALVGGGGKTSFMYRLAEDDAVPPLEAGERRAGFTVFTTTTKLQRPCPLPGTSLLDSPRPPTGWDSNPGSVLWVSGQSPDGAKWISPPKAAIETYLADPDRGRVVIEADGSAGRPIKVPGKEEPVIPEGVDLVIAVIGLSGFGVAAGADVVHRLEAYRELVGRDGGDPVATAQLLTILTHPNGVFRGTPPGTARYVLLNQADTVPPGLEGEVRGLPAAILEADDRITSVAVASLGKDRHFSEV